MLDLATLRTRIEWIHEAKDRGFDALPMRVVLADLATPFLKLLDELEAGVADRWVTLEEAMVRTGWKRKYFDKRLASLGGRSRLEVWQEAGCAEKAEPGIWLISPVALPPRKPGYSPPSVSPAENRTTPAPRQNGNAAAIADELFG